MVVAPAAVASFAGDIVIEFVAVVVGAEADARMLIYAAGK